MQIDLDEINIEQLTADAEKGISSALNTLGYLYDTGEKVEENPVKAAELYGQAADQRFAPAQHNLALLYYEGRGVEQNLEKAFWLLRESANQLPEAHYALGHFYLNGIATEINKDEAINHYMRAAESGLAQAIRKLATLHDDLRAELSLKIRWTNAAKGTSTANAEEQAHRIFIFLQNLTERKDLKPPPYEGQKASLQEILRIMDRYP